MDTPYAWAPGEPPLLARERSAIVRGHPIAPVSFDATCWTGEDICWSSWFCSSRIPWRALVVRGSIIQALQRRIPDLALGVEIVKMVGAEGPPPRPPGHRVGAEDPVPPPPPPLTALCVQIRQQAEKFRHRIPQGALDDDIRPTFASLEGAPPDELLDLLRWSNGMRLFGEALTFYAVGDGETLAEMNRIAGESGYPIGKGMVAFAERPGGSVVWASDSQGLVHGLGREGILYGPGAPFRSWFADQLIDLAYAAENERRLTWTANWLS